MRQSERQEGYLVIQNSSASCIAVQEFLGPARGLRPGGAGAPPPPSHMGSIPQRDASPPRCELRAQSSGCSKPIHRTLDALRVTRPCRLHSAAGRLAAHAHNRATA